MSTSETYTTIIAVAQWIRDNSDREDDIKRIKSGKNFASVNEQFQQILKEETIRKEQIAIREEEERQELKDLIQHTE